MRDWTLLAFFTFLILPCPGWANPLPGTQPLTGKQDWARKMYVDIDAELGELTRTFTARRRAAWKPDISSLANHELWQKPQRDKLSKMLGIVDKRQDVRALEFVGDTGRDALLAESDLYTVQAVRWPVLPGVYGEGLWLRPKQAARARVVVVPDADQQPEIVAGIGANVPSEAKVGRRLAEAGCEVLIVALVDRQNTWSANPRIGRATNQPHREFIYRMAYEMGRHIIGYEIQKIQGAVDWCARGEDRLPLGLCGAGEGGLLSLYTAALDPRIDAVLVSGYFGPREGLHNEPIYRNVWGLLRHFGDAEIASLIAPRGLVVEDRAFVAVPGPPASRPGRSGAAPGRLQAFEGRDVEQEFITAAKWWRGLEAAPRFRAPVRKTTPALADFYAMLTRAELPVVKTAPPALLGAALDPAPRQRRQVEQLAGYTQSLLAPASRRRDEFVWARLDRSTLTGLEKSQAPLRTYFHEEVIGKLPSSSAPLNPRTRLLFEEPKWKAYEVVLDVADNVACYGILLVPTDLKGGERRPVVVCQHGLEGRPMDVVDPRKTHAVLQLFRRPACRPWLHRLRATGALHLRQ